MKDQRPGSERSVIVIGGGLAGIAAALGLARHGVSVTLLEARRRLGGRAGSFPVRDAQGVEIDAVDYCQHVGMGCCTNLQQLIEWLGQRSYWREYDELHFYGARGNYQRLRALPGLPAPWHLSGWLLGWPEMRLRDRIRVARGLLAIRKVRTGNWANRQSAIEWLRGQGQTPTALAAFWGTLCSSALGEALERVNLAALAHVLQTGFLNHRRAFHLLVPQRPLAELFDRQAGLRLEEYGVRVIRGSPIDYLRCARGNVVDVRSGGNSHRGHAVVLATAWHQLPRVAEVSDSAELRQLALRAGRLESSPVTGIHTWWDRAWMPHSQAALVGRWCQWVFAKSGSECSGSATADGGAAGCCYYQIVVSGCRGLMGGDRRGLENRIRNDLAAVFPEVQKAKLFRCKTVTDPQAVFSVTPDSLEYRPNPRVCNNVILAGDWTNTGWPATMEGAVLSGFRAAEMLLHEWKLPVSVVRAPLS